MPKLKRKLTTLEGLDEKFVPLYTKQQDGTFLLDADDSDVEQKLIEFRERNKQLHDENTAIKSKYEPIKDIDIEVYRRGQDALGRLAKGEEADLIKNGRFEELLERKTNLMKADFERQLQSVSGNNSQLSEENKALRRQLEEVVVDVALENNAGRVGAVRKGAMEDVKRRGRDLWGLDKNGKDLVLKKDVYDKDGKRLTPETWAQGLIESCPWFFESGVGGNAGGGKGERPETHEGKIVIDRTNAEMVGKYAKEIMDGSAVVR